MKAIYIASLVVAGLVHAGPDYQLHEWGTFTTVSGSDGVLLSGLQREEETLPSFVHSHLGFENGQAQDPNELNRIYQEHGTLGFSPPQSKGLGDRPVAGVTVKMETPVIYFHSNETSPFNVTVKVGFNGGTISQWYPHRSSGEILPEPPRAIDPVNHPTPIEAWTIDFSKGWHGSIEWKADVLPPDETRAQILFKPGDNVGWLRARQPVTNAVRTTSGQTEGYLFYRGVGNFTPGLKTTVSADETLHLENQTGGSIPYLVVVERVNGILRWSEHTAGLDANGTLSFPESSLHAAPQGFCEALYRSVTTGLASCGLSEAEARAMAETWWNSYFEATGLRVFWVLPRETTDKLLPLEVSPVPSEIIRVLVGRSEVFRPRMESDWLATSRKTGEEAYMWQMVQADRFGLAIRERVGVLQAR